MQEHPNGSFLSHLSRECTACAMSSSKDSPRHIHDERSSVGTVGQVKANVGTGRPRAGTTRVQGDESDSGNPEMRVYPPGVVQDGEYVQDLGRRKVDGGGRNPGDACS